MMRAIPLVAAVATLALLNAPAFGKTYQLPHDVQVDVNGYVGWKQIVSSVQHDYIPSVPELGASMSVKLTDRIALYDQVKYGKTFNEVLVYSQLAYTPYIPVSDLSVTLKAGKIQSSNTLYNETRVNPRTRQGVFQPQSIYWNVFGQGVTSGWGVGFDATYKDLKLTYIADKQVILHPDTEAKAWTSQDTSSLQSKFGGHHMVALEYDFPNQNIRTILSWTRSEFTVFNNSTGLRSPTGGDYVVAGAEWEHEKLTLSFEGLLAKRKGNIWTDLNKLNTGFSATVQYDIHENVTLRANYNQYDSSTPVKYPQQAYNRDVNAGIGFHKGNWVANIGVNYVRGGRVVDPDNFNADPGDYKDFMIYSTNLVYFFD